MNSVTVLACHDSLLEAYAADDPEGFTLSARVFGGWAVALISSAKRGLGGAERGLRRDRVQLEMPQGKKWTGIPHARRVRAHRLTPRPRVERIGHRAGRD